MTKENEGNTEVFEEAVVENEQISCTNCGMILAKDQMFCPQCGNKNDSQNNVVEAAKKKTPIKTILISIIAVLVVLGAVGFGGYKYYQKQGDAIVKMIEKNKFSKDSLVSKYKKLGVFGQLIARDEIVDAFIDLVAENPYTNESSGILDIEKLTQYEEYKEIADTLKITSKDNKNVMKYINQVLKLKEYKKYYDVSLCLTNSVGDYSTAMNYITKAADSSSYLALLYARYALNYLQDAVSAAKEYESDDELVTQYIENLEVVENTVYQICYGSVSSTSSASTAIAEIGNLAGDLAEVIGEIGEIVDDLPTVKK